jgi:hypothetical protein
MILILKKKKKKKKIYHIQKKKNKNLLKIFQIKIYLKLTIKTMKILTMLKIEGEGCHKKIPKLQIIQEKVSLIIKFFDVCVK